MSSNSEYLTLIQQLLDIETKKPTSPMVLWSTYDYIHSFLLGTQYLKGIWLNIEWLVRFLINLIYCLFPPSCPSREPTLLSQSGRGRSDNRRSLYGNEVLFVAASSMPFSRSLSFIPLLLYRKGGAFVV